MLSGNYFPRGCSVKHYRVFSGYGYDEFELVAFDKDLQNADIGDYNIVKVSSILPLNCLKTKTIDLA